MWWRHKVTERNCWWGVLGTEFPVGKRSFCSCVLWALQVFKTFHIHKNIEETSQQRNRFPLSSVYCFCMAFICVTGKLKFALRTTVVDTVRWCFTKQFQLSFYRSVVSSQDLMFLFLFLERPPERPPCFHLDHKNRVCGDFSSNDPHPLHLWDWQRVSLDKQLVSGVGKIKANISTT